MNVILLDELNHNDRLRLMDFAIQCGADLLTLSDATPAAEDALRHLYIGIMQVSDTSEPPRMARLPVWRLTKIELGAIATCVEESLATGTVWRLLKLGGTKLKIYGDTAALQLVQHQWEELCRQGFNFQLVLPTPSACRNPYRAEDLPESRESVRVSSAPRKTIAQILARPQQELCSRPPAYGARRINPLVLSNDRIRKWWLPEHDEILRAQVQKDGWKWWPYPSALISVMRSDVFWDWTRTDPECLKSGWAPVLEEFARARANKLGFSENMAWPEDAAECALCHDKFSPSIHHRNVLKASPLFRNLCYTCIQDAYNVRDFEATREKVLAYIIELAAALKRIPSSGFGTSHADYGLLDEDNYIDVVKVLHHKPAEERVIAEFGSWFNALIESGVLNGDSRRLSRGTQCFAKDGHLCLSLAEKTIDDTLLELGMTHEKEFPYPEGRFKCDFLVGSTYIEYFGLHGNADYDVRTAEKIALCSRLDLHLVGIYPEDLRSRDALKDKLKCIKKAEPKKLGCATIPGI